MKYRILEVNNYGRVYYEIEYKNCLFWHKDESDNGPYTYATIENAESRIQLLKQGYSSKVIKEIE